MKLNTATAASFSVTKHGNSEVENEDRHAVRVKRNALVAMSDGATESAMAGPWAQALVQSAWKHALLADLVSTDEVVPQNRVQQWLEPLQEQFWNEHVRREAPWYLREKLRRGAAATFLGFRMSSRGRWCAVSTGDTCLLTVVNGNVTDSVPLCRAEQFDNQPELVSSRPKSTLPVMKLHHGTLAGNGDVIVLATDALAAWLLSDPDSPTRVRQLLSCSSHSDFVTLVAEERRQLTLKNDDTTALIVRR